MIKKRDLSEFSKYEFKFNINNQLNIYNDVCGLLTKESNKINGTPVINYLSNSQYKNLKHKIIDSIQSQDIIKINKDFLKKKEIAFENISSKLFKIQNQNLRNEYLGKYLKKNNENYEDFFLKCKKNLDMKINHPQLNTVFNFDNTDFNYSLSLTHSNKVKDFSLVKDDYFFKEYDTIFLDNKDILSKNRIQYIYDNPLIFKNNENIEIKKETIEEYRPYLDYIDDFIQRKKSVLNEISSNSLLKYTDCTQRLTPYFEENMPEALKKIEEFKLCGNYLIESYMLYFNVF